MGNFFLVPHQCVVSLHYGIFRRGDAANWGLGFECNGMFLLNRTLKEILGGWGKRIVCKGQQEQPQPLTTLVIAKLLGTGLYPPVVALLCLDGLF